MNEQQFDEIELLALRKFVYRAAGFGPNDDHPENYDLHDAVEDASSRLNKLEALEERVDQLEYVNDELVTDLPTQTKSKLVKKADILRRVAAEAPEEAARYAINRDLAAGVADCTGRHALTLFGELAETYPWAEYAPDADPQAKLRVSFGEDGPDAFLERIQNEFPVVDR